MKNESNTLNHSANVPCGDHESHVSFYEKDRYYTDIIGGMAERTNKRQTIIIIILIALFVLTNAFWIYREMQYTDETIAVIQRNEDGYNSYIGDDGDINNGYWPDASEMED